MACHVERWRPSHPNMRQQIVRNGSTTIRYGHHKKDCLLRNLRRMGHSRSDLCFLSRVIHSAIQYQTMWRVC